MRQLPLPVRLRASSVFGSFFSGPNHAAVQQLEALIPGQRPPVVWLYGQAGTGKTHLLQALCAQAGERQLAAAYLPLREWAVQDADVLSGCESLAYLCLDDIGAIAGNAAWERALFRLYTELEESGGRMIVAADAAPAATAIQLRDLASRLGAGTVLRLQTLSDEEQIGALQLRAMQLGLELPFEVAQLLMRRLPRDMATLCAMLEKLDEASLATQRRLTVPFVRDVLEASSLGAQKTDERGEESQR
jgi:DnaA family protein